MVRAGLSSATPPEYDGEGAERHKRGGSFRIRRCNDVPLARMRGCSCEVRRRGLGSGETAAAAHVAGG
ncbi:membrane protein [Sesbania bispinosa]|nr:membrane protein [Sesbania bispinosa]